MEMLLLFGAESEVRAFKSTVHNTDSIVGLQCPVIQDSTVAQVMWLSMLLCCCFPYPAL